MNPGELRLPPCLSFGLYDEAGTLSRLNLSAGRHPKQTALLQVHR